MRESKIDKIYDSIILATFKRKSYDHYESEVRVITQQASQFRQNLRNRNITDITQKEAKILIDGVIFSNIRRNGKFNCYYCRKELTAFDFSIDHKIPISKGGEPVNGSNLTISCIECNQRKDKKSVREYLDILSGKVPDPRGKHIYKAKNPEIGKRKIYLRRLKQERETDELKLCTKCLKLKERSNKYFNRQTRAKDGLQSDCKECHRAEGREYKRKKRTQKHTQ